MKFTVFAILMMSSFHSYAQTASGTVLCSLTHEQSSRLKTERKDIVVQANGKGGVSEVTVADQGFVCTGVGLIKFDDKILYRITLTSPSGESVSLSSTKDYGQELQHSSGMNCICQVRGN